MNEKTLRGIANDLRNELIKACPRTTSNLATSIIVTPIKKGGKESLEIEMLDYGEYVEYGTNPHIIQAKNKKALAFQKGGDTIIVKRVNHPGTRPNPFIRTTLHNKLAMIIKQNMQMHEI